MNYHRVILDFPVLETSGQDIAYQILDAVSPIFEAECNGESLMTHGPIEELGQE